MIEADELLEREGMSIRMLYERQSIEGGFNRSRTRLFGEDAHLLRLHGECTPAWWLAERMGENGSMFATVPAFFKSVPELSDAWAGGLLNRIELEGQINGDAGAMPESIKTNPAYFDAWMRGMAHRSEIDYQAKVSDWMKAADEDQFEMACRIRSSRSP